MTKTTIINDLEKCKIRLGFVLEILKARDDDYFEDIHMQLELISRYLQDLAVKMNTHNHKQPCITTQTLRNSI